MSFATNPSMLLSVCVGARKREREREGGGEREKERDGRRCLLLYLGTQKYLSHSNYVGEHVYT